MSTRTTNAGKISLYSVLRPGLQARILSVAKLTQSYRKYKKKDLPYMIKEMRNIYILIG